MEATIPDEGGAGVPLEPGSNLPPGDSTDTSTSGTTDLLLPADSAVGGG